MSTALAPTPYKAPRFERTKALLRSPTFVAGVLILLFWVLCATIGQWLVPQDPYASDPPQLPQRHPMPPTGSAPTSSAAMCSLA